MRSRNPSQFKATGLADAGAQGRFSPFESGRQGSGHGTTECSFRRGSFDRLSDLDLAHVTAGTRALILDQPGFTERDQTTGSARDRIDYVLVKSGFEDGLRPLRLAGSGTYSLPVITLIFSRAAAWEPGRRLG